jgi:spectrin beta
MFLFVIQCSRTEEDLRIMQEIKRDPYPLLIWCQRRTTGYPGVKINDFSDSWRNGLAFNLLLHTQLVVTQKTDVVNFSKLNPNDHIGNLKKAFYLAEKLFGIPQILDAEG